jgi:NAD(P)-dependent dehydrogenase (short-subunit alcohol dehydrogenase family)
MNKKEISSRNNLYRRDFLSGIAAIAATTTPSLAGSTPVGAGQNLPQTAPVPTSRPNGRLRDKVAVVTGAARGISRATAVAFAREGADIIGLDICAPVDPRSGVEPSTQEGWEETGRLVRMAGRRWLGIKLDQRDLPALRAAGVRGEREFGGIDILFAKRAHGTKFGASYSVTKWGIIGLMKLAALELESYNIMVNVLFPGLIDTPLTRHKERYPQVLEAAGKSPKGLSTTQEEEEPRKILTTRTPLGVPWIEPEDVAPVVVFLASDAVRMVSGATFDVTGGDSANNTA